MSIERSDELRSHYANNSISFDWLSHPNQHSFRWKTIEGKWVTSYRRVKNHETLMKAIGKDIVSDLYISTSRWLEPIDLPRLRDTDRPHPILLDHLIVFDIDVAPLSYQNLEKARTTAVNLYKYLENESTIKFLSCSFSGSKGFHLFYTDLERDTFAIEDPKEREEEVKKKRKELLTRVIDEGFPVDPRVTADTRRIIRLPGSLHGTTGFQCTRLELQDLNQPIKQLINEIPKIQSALEIPKRAKPPKKKKPKKKKPKAPKTPHVSKQHHLVEASTHVPGTKDRSVIFFWLPLRWGSAQEAMEQALDLMDQEDLGLCSFWQQNEQVLMLCPLALPRAQVIKIYSKFGLKKQASVLKEREHDWIQITDSLTEDAEWTGTIEPIGLFGTEQNSERHYSISHLELEHRMGIHRKLESDVNLSGNSKPTLRIVVRE